MKKLSCLVTLAFVFMLAGLAFGGHQENGLWSNGLWSNTSAAGGMILEGVDLVDGQLVQR